MAGWICGGFTAAGNLITGLSVPVTRQRGSICSPISSLLKDEGSERVLLSRRRTAKQQETANPAVSAHTGVVPVILGQGKREEDDL